MPVIQRVRFVIFSRDELQDLENDIIKLEQLAARKEAASSRIDAKRRSRQRAYRAPIFGGIGYELDEDPDVLPSNIMRRKRATLTSRKADSDAFNAIKSKDKTSRSPIKADNIVISRLDKLEEASAKVQEDLSKIQGFISSPYDFVLGMLGSNVGVARFLGITGLVLGIGRHVLKMVEDYYGPGGGGDIRVQTRDETKTIPELDFLLNVRGGRVFFTGDTRVRSGLVANSVSENLGDRDRLYRELNIGTGLLD